MSQSAEHQVSPLLHADWRYVDQTSLEQFSPQDWQQLHSQRQTYYREQQARQALRMLADSEHDSTFGYKVNNYRHCLQSATLALRDGLSEEDIVVCLFHDIGFITCPDSHGEFAAALLGNYVSERNRWMLKRHAIFQDAHARHHPSADLRARDRWLGHPHFEWAATFVDRYDQAAIDPAYDCAPLSHFEPMVMRVFARPSQPLPLD
jgi:predicted HD phosphohydrolase